MQQTQPVAEAPARLQALASWQVSKISTLASRLTAQRMPLSGRADSAVLAALEQFGSLSQADLGRLLGLDRNDVNGIVGRLEAASSLTRQPDPADRRRNIVAITDGGRVRVAELFEQATGVQAELLVALTPAERIQLTGLLAKVLRGHAPQPA